MKNKRNIIILSIFIFIMTGCFFGCGSLEGNGVEELQIKEIENHLLSWQEKLPSDTEYKTIEASAVRGLVVEKNGEMVFAVSYEPREEKEAFDYWDISIPYKSLVSVNTEELYNLFGMVLQMDWIQTASINLEDAGIADSKTSIFIAYNKEQKPEEKGEVNPTNTRTILIGNADGQGNYYVALKGTDKVAIINKSLVDAILNVDAYQYILKLPVLVYVDTVKKIQIVLGEKVHKMEQDKDNWKLDGKNVEQEEFQTLYRELLSVMISGKIEEGHNGEKKEKLPVLTVQFLRSIENATDIEVKYYEYDDKSMSVSVNGQEYFIVDKKSVEELQKVIEDSLE